MYFMALIFFVLVFAGLRRLINAPLGRVFVGIRENEQRMLAIGYPTRAYKLLSFTIAGALAGLAGGLYAIFNGFISADALYWTASGDVLIMTMLGGAGTLIGPAIGAGVFLLMKNVVSSYSEHWLADHRHHLHLLRDVLPRRHLGRAAALRTEKSAAMTALRIDHLNRSFGSLVVTDDVNLDIAAGERHVIIGPNGAGKTSLVNQIGGQLAAELRPHLCRRPATSPAVRRTRSAAMGVARTFQRNNLFQNLSRDREPAARPGGALRQPAGFLPAGRPQPDRSMARARSLMAQVHLGSDGSRLVRSLSYGEQRQLEIGMALAGDPELLLLDEPTSGMSPAETARMIELIAHAAADLGDPDDRARHEGGVLGRRPHHRALLRKDSGDRHARRNPGQCPRARGLSRDDALMLELDNVHAYYGDSHVLHGVSLTVAQGRGRLPAGQQRRRQDHDDPHHHGLSASQRQARPLQRPRYRERCRPTRWRGSVSASCRRNVGFSQALPCAKT